MTLKEQAAVLISLLAWPWWALPGRAAETTPPAPPAPESSQTGTSEAVKSDARRSGRLYIAEYRVLGSHRLTPLEVEEAVYPFLGPERGAEDVEEARAALEKAYRAKGYQTVSVQIPPQRGAGGVVYLQVVESKVGRLRVVGARYFSPEAIRKAAPSVAEGEVPNFNDLTHDIVGLNQLPDRQVTPSLRAGAEPGTVDVDLNVKDTLPLHGSIELNNRYSADTTPLRVNGAISYDNLWQLGHAAGFSFQLAPEDPGQVEVFSAYYEARLPGVDWLNVVVQGTKQNTNVSTLGALDVAGKGEVIGTRINFTLPGGNNFYHTLSLGLDYKNFDQQELIASSTTQVETPIQYYPITGAYSATWSGKGYLTQLDGSVVYGVRGIGSRSAAFDNSRYNADANFFYIRGDLSHTHDLPGGVQVFGKVQGQLADQPLVNSEQFAAGGLGTVRGYLESEVLGDNAVLGTVELRSPSLVKWLSKDEKANEWRIYVFADGADLTIRDPLPEQVSQYYLASYGVGSWFRLENHLNGSIDAGIPLFSQAETSAGHPRITFRVWGDF